MYKRTPIVQFGEYVRKAVRDLSTDVYQGLIAFAISHFFFLIGMLILNVSGLLSFTLDIDVLLYIIFFQYLQIGLNSQLMFFSSFGWFVAGIFMRIKFPESGARPLIYGSAFLPLFAIFFVSYMSFIVLISNIEAWNILFPLVMTFLLSTFPVAGIIYVFIIILALPGIILIKITGGSVKKASTSVRISPNFLVSPYVIEDNVKTVCPFKDPELNGCSYLGYKGPPLTLICDHPETFRQCLLYAHLYDKRLEVIDYLAEDDNS